MLLPLLFFLKDGNIIEENYANLWATMNIVTNKKGYLVRGYLLYTC